MARPVLSLKPDQASQPAPSRQPDLQKISGLPAVTALFANDPQRVERLFFDERMKEAAVNYCRTQASRRKPYRQVPTEELTKIAGSPLHGGIIAVAHPKPVQPFAVQQAAQWAQERLPLLILDGIGNPHNLGAIARTMAFFGLKHLIVSDHPGQALPSEAAYRVAEGGLEWVQVHRAANLSAALKELRQHYRVIGTALGAHRPLMEVMAPSARPLAVILGNEEGGLPPATLQACDEIVTIPGSGQVQSLNVAATAAIFAHLLGGSGK